MIKPLLFAFSCVVAAGCSSTTASSSDELYGCTTTSKRSHPITLSVWPEAGEAPLVNALEKAKSTIRVMVYMMGTDGVYETLKAKATAGVDVKVILDGGAQRTFNTPAFDGLTAAGVQVKWSNPKFSYMHAKTLVVDAKEAVISTGNYPLDLIETERNYLATDDDAKDAKAIVAIFDADWNGVDPDLSCTRLVVSPVNSHDRILAEIGTAKTSLHIESLELSDPDLLAAIVGKKAAGLDVQILLADPTWTKGSTNAANAAKLKASGIPVRWIPKSTMLVHVKNVIVDGKTAYMGSENLTTTSFEHNREIGLIVTDATPIKTMEQTFAGDFASAIPF